MNRIKHLAAMPLLVLAGNAQASGADVEIAIEGARNSRGVIHICMTRNASHFPDCGDDPSAVKRTVPASTRSVRVTVSPGPYAVSLFHDQNRNNELDTFLGIPREGFGFSRNPTIRFGPPSFDSVRINIIPGSSRMTVNMQYFL